MSATENVVIVVHVGELDHPEQLATKIIRNIRRHHLCAEFRLKIPERDTEHSMITSGPQKRGL